MKRVIFHPEAQAEYDDAFEYFGLQRNGLDKRFRNDLLATLRLIRKFPLIGSLVLQSVCRKRRLKEFTYNVVYRVDPDRIFIFAIAHTSRNPGYWVKRLSK